MQRAQPAPVLRSSASDAAPRLTLVAQRTAIRLFLLLSLCIGGIWFAEGRAGLLVPSDRIAYPLMMVWFLALTVLVWRRPSQLLLTQGLVTVGVGAYLVGTIGYALLVEREISLYSAASLGYWVMGAHLLLFFTWPASTAWGLSIAITLLSTLPAVVVQFEGTTMAGWSDVLWPLYINGFCAQAMLGVVLFGIARQVSQLIQLTPMRNNSPTGDAFTVNEFIAHRMRDLELARDAAEQASDAKSRFLATMSHELRTPLHGVLGAADLLRDQSTPAKQRAELIETVRRGGTHLLHLINDVLDLSRIEAGRVEIFNEGFDLNLCLAHVRDTMQPQAQAKSLKLNYRAAPKLPPFVLGDEFRLKQVLINLIGNALKFTDSGYVSLEVDYDRARSELLLRIQDTGIGIAPNELARVFDAFHQADSGSTRRFAGTGLGLAITRQLVTLMGGRIMLDSQPGVGTRVQLQLPLPVSDSPGREPMTSTVSFEADLNGVRALLVDDDPINTMIAEQMLRGVNIEVRTVHSGIAALEALAQGGFDVVLMDWLMPGMDGLEATRRMRSGLAGETARTLPVIGLTAHAFAEDRAACLQAGMDEVLVKPVSRVQLLRAVKRAVEVRARP